MGILYPIFLTFFYFFGKYALYRGWEVWPGALMRQEGLFFCFTAGTAYQWQAEDKKAVASGSTGGLIFGWMKIS